MTKISKSKYTSFTTCAKQFWLGCHKSELAVVDDSTKGRFEAGHQVGEYAKKLFDDVVDVTTLTSDGKLDVAAMIKQTQKLINDNCSAIAEAAFSTNDTYCAVDILKNNNDGSFDIYEVKSSTSIKDIYVIDVAFQKYVLESCNLKIRSCYIVTINNKYVKNGDIEPQQLFKIEDVTDSLSAYSNDIATNICAAQATYAAPEPDCRLHGGCSSPYLCAYYGYCSAHLPNPSIFDVYKYRKKFENYHCGIVSFEDIRKNNVKLNEQQLRQVDSYLDDSPMHVDKAALKSFLSQIKYPIYFLDFETFQTAIPLYDGQSPYMQVPFQYSLHILKDKHAESLQHAEFLADEDRDELRVLAERLANDIPNDGGTIVAYNKSFEIGRIKEMAARFSDLSDKLMSLTSRFVDLKDVFCGGMVYKKEMGGSFSIKSVLPAMFPNDPNLNYHNLVGVQNGTDAMAAYLNLKYLPIEERKRVRDSLLAYCKLDTLALSVLYKELCILVY